MARSRTPGDKVGYGNPPSHTRFKPGQSGNPSGRRKRKPEPPPPAGVSEDDAMLLRILDEEVCATVDGRKRRMTRREAMLRGLVDQATAGDIRATRIVQERDVQARKARDIARSAEEGVDTAALILELAEVLRSKARGKADTYAPGSNGEADVAMSLERQPGAALREEEGVREPADRLDPDWPQLAAPLASRNTVAGRVQVDRENRPQEIEADMRATSVRETPPPSHDTGPVWGNQPDCISPRRTVRSPRPSNEPLIRDPRPLTF